MKDSNDGRPKNYLSGWGLLTTHYFYLDREPWVADHIFIEHELRVHFAGEYRRRGTRYRLVHAWVWRWKEHEFEECMDRLFNAAMLRDGMEYWRTCEMLEVLLKKEMA